MLVLLPYHSKWGEVLSNALCILHLYNSASFSTGKHLLFPCWLLSWRPTITMLFISFFLLTHDSSPPVFFMAMLNTSRRRLVTYVEFSKAPSLTTITCLHSFFSYFDVVSMKWIVTTWGLLDEVGNPHRIIYFEHTTVWIEVKP